MEILAASSDPGHSSLLLQTGTCQYSGWEGDTVDGTELWFFEKTTLVLLCCGVLA